MSVWAEIAQSICSYRLVVMNVVSCPTVKQETSIALHSPLQIWWSWKFAAISCYLTFHSFFPHLQTCWTTQTSTGSPPTAKCATMFSIQEKTTDASSVFLVRLQTAFLKGGLLASNSHTELCQPLSPCLNNRISPSPSAEILPVLVPTANRSIESGGDVFHLLWICLLPHAPTILMTWYPQMILHMDGWYL